MPNGTAVFGARVKVKDLDGGDEEVFELVGPGDEDYDNNKILVGSPIGQGLLGKKPGDVAEIQVPMGKLRYQIVEITNEYEGLPPRQVIGYRSWFTVTVRDTTDAARRLATIFVVDSIVADSAVFLPPTMNLAAARGLTVTGWVTPTGELQDAVFSDSGVVQSLSLLLGWFRHFFPNLPADGVQPGREWSDTLTTTEPGGAATVVRTTELRARAAAAWERRPEGEALRLDAAETYQFTGSGDGGGQPLELRGTGMRAGTDYIAADGRYLGGTGRDSVALTITLPQQGITIPQRQLGTLSVQLLPR